MADDPECQQKMKRKRLLNRLEANNPDYVPDESNLKHPPKAIAITNSKSNSLNKVINVIDSLAILGDEVNQDLS